jgi:hypothetical protein
MVPIFVVPMFANPNIALPVREKRLPASSLTLATEYNDVYAKLSPGINGQPAIPMTLCAHVLFTGADPGVGQTVYFSVNDPEYSNRIALSAPFAVTGADGKAYITVTGSGSVSGTETIPIRVTWTDSFGRTKWADVSILYTLSSSSPPNTPAANWGPISPSGSFASFA